MADSADTATMQDGLGDLLRAVAKGDDRSFERLYRTTSPKLFGICLRVLPQRAEAEAVVAGDAGVVEPAERAAPSAATKGAAVPVSAASAERAAKKRRAREEEVATRMDADVLATELVNRGWCCIPPD